MASVEASKQLRYVMRGVSPVAENSEQESTSITEECTFVVSKHFWTAEKESHVKILFGEAIENIVITFEVVKEKISNHPELKVDNPKKVLDKVFGAVFGGTKSHKPMCQQFSLLRKRVPNSELKYW